MATKFGHDQQFSTGGQQFNVRRDEILDDRIWSTVKAVGFWISVIMLAIGLYLWGKSNGSTTPQVLAPPTTIYYDHGDRSERPSSAPNSCEMRCRSEHTNPQAIAYCLEKKCDP